MDGHSQLKQEVLIQVAQQNRPFFFLSLRLKLKFGTNPKLIMQKHEQNRFCLTRLAKLACPLFLSFSVEVNNFLKIDENQNEEVDGELPDSPVSIWDVF